MSKDTSIRKQASNMFNALPVEDRKKAGLGYALSQLNTIAQQRQANKEMILKEDHRLYEWAKNIEAHIKREYLNKSTTNQTKEG